MDEPQQGQNLLRDEVNRLKIQMSLVIDILQALLGKEGSMHRLLQQDWLLLYVRQVSSLIKGNHIQQIF